MRNAGLKEAQAGIKIAGRNISNLRYADDITLMAESEEELKSLLMKVKAAAAAAKLLQSCPTLCNPIDGSPHGAPVPGILQARTLEWAAIAMEYCSAIKRNVYIVLAFTVPFVATGMDLDIVTLSEVRQTEKGNYHMISLISGIKTKSSRVQCGSG